MKTKNGLYIHWCKRCDEKFISEFRNGKFCQSCKFPTYVQQVQIRKREEARNARRNRNA